MNNFEKFFSVNPAHTCNILLVGSKGIGKFSLLLRGVETWNPEYSERIKAFKTPDMLVLQGGESISEIKEKIEGFLGTNPVELKTKVLILRHLDYYSKEACDSLLKTIEENRSMSIFATAFSDKIRPALLSRMHAYKMSDLSQEQIQAICENSPKHIHFKAILEKWHFTSIFQLEMFSQYSFESLFSSLHTKAQSPVEIMDALDPFFAKSKELHDYEKLPLYYFFIEYMSSKILQDPAQDAKSKRYKTYLIRTILRYSQSLLENLHNPMYYSQVNLEHQVTGFFLAIFALRFI